MSECTICIETLKNPVNCPKCDGIYCRTCFQKYLLTYNETCMHCRTSLSEDFIYENTDSVWRNTVYMNFKQRLLFEKEVARLPQEQSNAEYYLKAKEEIRRIDKLLPSAGYALRQDLSRARHYYLGVVKGFGLAAAASDKKAIKRTFVKGCISNGCKGFLDSEFKCGLCTIQVCRTCYEVKQDAHVCNPDQVLSVKAIKSESHPCPTCTTLISKIDGCDQMWCTQCRTAFSWTTGLVEQGTVHNPHFYEWARKNGGLARHPLDEPTACDRFIDVYDLRNCFSIEEVSDEIGDLTTLDTLKDRRSSYQVLMKIHRYVHHVKGVYVDGQRLEPNDNNDLRVRYLTNELVESRFKQLLLQRDTVFKKGLALRHIYDMIYKASGDLFRNLYDERFESHPDLATRDEFKRLFHYGNECLRRLEDRYGVKLEKMNYLE